VFARAVASPIVHRALASQVWFGGRRAQLLKTSMSCRRVARTAYPSISELPDVRGKWLTFSTER
jgi:hypothetical protein